MTSRRSGHVWAELERSPLPAEGAAHALHQRESGVDAYVLHAGDVLALALRDGVPDGHVVGRQVQFVGTGQRVIAGERSARVGTGSSSRWKIVRWTVHRSDCGSASISCQDEPGKRTRRSLTYSPRLGEPLAGERGSVIARAGISLNARVGHASPDFAP
jgi:hypothetical protein